MCDPFLLPSHGAVAALRARTTFFAIIEFTLALLLTKSLPPRS
jgi:hypothetical protein